ncbi:hypothetical protein KIPB_008003 [Kipferlia bialata]|uniref:DNA polymerase epsilon catalytic subunit n=1 Tax=Kipferlia bialata TaxID=797122 RepID=A0A9K3D122_9EUKA|nr:hypothetical protein KIPB_008003 [Kipferlia bialata]|eukprot:g8003.t1
MIRLGRQYVETVLFETLMSRVHMLTTNREATIAFAKPLFALLGLDKGCDLSTKSVQRSILGLVNANEYELQATDAVAKGASTAPYSVSSYPCPYCASINTIGGAQTETEEDSATEDGSSSSTVPTCHNCRSPLDLDAIEALLISTVQAASKHMAMANCTCTHCNRTREDNLSVVCQCHNKYAQRDRASKMATCKGIQALAVRLDMPMLQDVCAYVLGE